MTSDAVIDPNNNLGKFPITLLMIYLGNSCIPSHGNEVFCSIDIIKLWIGFGRFLDLRLA